MKQYTKHYELSSRVLRTQENVLLGAPVGHEDDAERNAPASSSIADSTKTHVLTSPLLEAKDTFIQEAFQEWETWLQSYRLQRLQRPSHLPFTPTDWENHDL